MSALVRLRGMRELIPQRMLTAHDELDDDESREAAAPRHEG